MALRAIIVGVSVWSMFRCGQCSGVVDILGPSGHVARIPPTHTPYAWKLEYNVYHREPLNTCIPADFECQI